MGQTSRTKAVFILIVVFPLLIVGGVLGFIFQTLVVGFRWGQFLTDLIPDKKAKP